jgi:hypothetical protein
MNIEVKKDSAHVFNFPGDVFGDDKWFQNQKQKINSAKITIKSANNETLIDDVDMMTDTDQYTAYYEWDSTDQPVDCDYTVLMTINGVCYNRFFDIYLFPFQNTVCDNDLFREDRELQRDSYNVSGTAESGSTTTLIDSNRIENDGHFNGGLIEFYFDNKTEIREVKSYVDAQKKFIFDEISNAIVDGVGYSVRQSYQDLIDLAGERIQEKFQQLEKRAYLLMDHTQAKTAIIYMTLALYWLQKRKEEGDEYDLKYTHYDKSVDTFFIQTHWKYDKDADGQIEDGEKDVITKIQWER